MMRNVIEQLPVLALVLPDFYQTDFGSLPTSGLIPAGDILQHLKQDPAKHGVVIADKVAIWNSAEGQTPEGYWYVQHLPMDDPGDGTAYETADEALYEAISLAIS